MPGWRELQACFGQAVLTGDFAALAPHVRQDGMAVTSRIKIYRNNSVTSLTSILAERFGVVEQLVGAEFFAFAAEGFIAQSPPAKPYLDLYGARFPAFLAELPACGELPYLADVARLEWKLFTVARAPFAPPAGIEILNGLDPAQAMGLRLHPDPAIEYLSSPWPVDRIWQAHQGEMRELAISAAATLLELRRHDGQLLMRALPPAEFAFRSALAAGATLADAVTSALNQSADFEFAAALADLFQEQWVAGYTGEEKTA